MSHFPVDDDGTEGDVAGLEAGVAGVAGEA